MQEEDPLADGGVSGIDEVLVARASGGDSRAFERLYREHVGRVHGLCLRMVRDLQLAEDYTQETFIRAWRALDRFEARSQVSTWLHRIAVNTSIEMLRRRQSAQDDSEELLAEAVDVHSDPSIGVSQFELVRGVGEALQQLTTLERSVFVLRHLEQRSLHEIALLLSSNVNACKQAIFRAVRKLRAQLAHLEASVP